MPVYACLCSISDFLFTLYKYIITFRCGMYLEAEYYECICQRDPFIHFISRVKYPTVTFIEGEGRRFELVTLYFH